MRTKKNNWMIGPAIIIVIIEIVVLPFLGAMIQNDIILKGYANQLYTLPLPANTTLICQNKSVGNLYGTGNHLDFAVSMEVNSFLSVDELEKYYNTIYLKSANEISGMKLDIAYPDVDVPHWSGKIEVIPKDKALLEIGSSKIYIKGDVTDSNVDKEMFIIQIIDTHYAPGWDLRAH